MEYEFQVGDFQGPLDLLYKLVKKKKIKITELSLAQITEEYLEYLEHLKGFNLELASEFMVIASELLELKARLLLPRNGEKKNDENNDSLVHRLEEYKKFKKVSQVLRQYEEISANCYQRVITNNDSIPAKIKINSTAEDLAKIYKKAISKNTENTEQKLSLSNMNYVNTERISTDEKRKFIMNKVIRKNKKMKFTQLLQDRNDILEIVVTLLSILELMRLKKIEVFQDNLFQEIFIKPGRVVDKVESG